MANFLALTSEMDNALVCIFDPVTRTDLCEIYSDARFPVFTKTAVYPAGHYPGICPMTDTPHGSMVRYRKLVADRSFWQLKYDLRHFCD